MSSSCTGGPTGRAPQAQHQQYAASPPCAGPSPLLLLASPALNIGHALHGHHAALQRHHARGSVTAAAAPPAAAEAPAPPSSSSPKPAYFETFSVGGDQTETLPVWRQLRWCGSWQQVQQLYDACLSANDAAVSAANGAPRSAGGQALLGRDETYAFLVQLQVRMCARVPFGLYWIPPLYYVFRYLCYLCVCPEGGYPPGSGAPSCISCCWAA